MHEAKKEWIEWAAYNLASGIPEADIKSEMVRNGFSVDDVNRTLLELSGSPAYRASLRLARNLKLCCALNEALLDLESQAFDFKRLTRTSRLSSTEFHTQYYCTNRPVVIEDVVPSWPACSKWNLDFFRREFGNEPVRYQSGRSPIDHRDSFVDHTVEASLSDFLDAVEHSSQTGNRPYLIAHDRLLDKAPFKGLLNDIDFDSRYFDGKDTHGRVFFWLGPAGSMTPMHRDLGNVYLAQITGRKLIRMVPAKQLHLMYNEVGYHSEADFENLSLEQFPLLKKASIMEEIIYPGDLLFIPVGWWHFVKSLDTTISITGNNFRFSNALPPIFE